MNRHRFNLRPNTFLEGTQPQVSTAGRKARLVAPGGRVIARVELTEEQVNACQEVDRRSIDGLRSAHEVREIERICGLTAADLLPQI